jgi:hypothetical protein
VPPISCVFTSNGRTVNGKMQPPAELLPRFLSRCLVLNFETVERKPLAAYLDQVWDKEHGPRPYPVEYFEHLADGMGVRDALNRLDSELLAPRPLGEISRILTDRKAAEIEQEAKKVNGFELLVDVPPQSATGDNCALSTSLPVKLDFRAGSVFLRVSERSGVVPGAAT